MLGFAEVFFAWLASTGGPALAGLVLALIVGKYLRRGYFLAFSLGIIIWVFSDVIDDATKLDVEESFFGGWEQFVIVALFALAIVVFFSLDGSLFSPDVKTRKGLFIPILIAIAVGVHGLGEGGAFGQVSATTPFTSLILAFGGEAAGAGYVIHKFLESLAIGAGYLAFSGGETFGISRRLRDAVLLAVVFITPSVVAMAVGYYIVFDVVYYYALGSGALLFVILKLSGPLFSTDRVTGSYGSLKVAIWLLAGLLIVYAAALFHSYF